jgi:hypothetical protein
LVSQMVLGRRLLSEYSARYSIFVELLIFITNERVQIRKPIRNTFRPARKIRKSFRPICDGPHRDCRGREVGERAMCARATKAPGNAGMSA